MENYIIAVILIAIIGAIVFYLVRARKRGEKCIGCPYAKQCSRKCGGNMHGGHCKTEQNKISK